MSDSMFLTLLGLWMIYSVVHFFILQNRAYKDRTSYEKVVSWSAMIGITLSFLGIMFG